MTQLKFVLKSNDFYNKRRSNYLQIVHVEKNTDFEKFYVVEDILIKESRKFEKSKIAQYFIR